MEVLVGPTIPAHVSNRASKPAQDSGNKNGSSNNMNMNNSNRAVMGETQFSSFGRVKPGLQPEIEFYFQENRSDSSSSDSSSIGVQSDDEDTNGVVSDKDGDDEEDEVSSKPTGGLGSLDSLEDSLPIKRGLSNYFMGKSKSFGNLSEVCTVKDLKKEENPLNKRRRTLLAMRNNKKSFYSWARNQPTSMPLLALPEEEEEEEEEESYEEVEQHPQHGKINLSMFGRERKFRNFQSPSCSCLTDLQEEEDEEE